MAWWLLVLLGGSGPRGLQRLRGARRLPKDSRIPDRRLPEFAESSSESNSECRIAWRRTALEEDHKKLLEAVQGVMVLLFV